MLRHEILTNFIHFQDTKKFDFQPNANIFIGENNSGKTSVFEGARRCLGLKENTSLSTAHFPDRRSSATCIFNIGNDQKLFSSMVRLPTKAADNQAVYVKAAYETVEQSFGIDLVKDTQCSALVNESVELADASKVKGLFRSCLQYGNSPDEVKIQNLLNHICTIISENVEKFKLNTEYKGIQETDCERILRKHVDDTTAFTFAVRGIGPCQWSKSHKVTSDCRTQNYKTAQERSEILQWYLEKVDIESITKEDEERVDEYFNIITNNSNFIFKIQNSRGENELVALNKISGKRSAGDNTSKPFAIMKVPEGISEAMNCAILLGVSNFKTVCLEEPEKGMHPQMIERIRDLVLRKIENKTVLITSHHPSFLGPWTIPKLQIFKRIENSDGSSFKAYCGLQIEEGYTDQKTPRIITSSHFASVFFAKKILFVEGEGDFLFMSALKQLVLSNNKHVNKLIAVGRLGRFVAFLCSLNIVSLDGETQKLRFRKLCKTIQTDNYFILDFDAILDDKKSAVKFLKDFNLTSYTSDAILENVTILEKEGLFVWKLGHTDDKGIAGKATVRKETMCKGKAGTTDRREIAGTIEDVIIDLANKHETLRKVLDKNHVILKYNPATKMQSRYKLFRSKETTDTNITLVVEEVIKCCMEDKANNRSTEMLRLVDFLVEKS